MAKTDGTGRVEIENAILAKLAAQGPYVYTMAKDLTYTVAKVVGAAVTTQKVAAVLRGLEARGFVRNHGTSRMHPTCRYQIAPEHRATFAPKSETPEAAPVVPEAKPAHASELPGSGMVYTPRAIVQPAQPAPQIVPRSYTEARRALHAAATRYASPVPPETRERYARSLESAATDYARFALRKYDGACPVCDAPHGARCVDAEGREMSTRHSDREG